MPCKRNASVRKLKRRPPEDKFSTTSGHDLPLIVRFPTWQKRISKYRKHSKTFCSRLSFVCNLYPSPCGAGFLGAPKVGARDWSWKAADWRWASSEDWGTAAIHQKPLTASKCSHWNTIRIGEIIWIDHNWSIHNISVYTYTYTNKNTHRRIHIHTYIHIHKHTYTWHT